MFIYETEGFLEVEAKSIKQLCRSTAAVPLEDSEDETYSVYAVLCDYLDNSEQRCRVAFYSKVMKRALIFAVRGSDKQSSWKHGQEVLAQLGFRLEDVNLKLSPAMLEVVLRDVPGLVSPADARKQRTEKALLLTELQETFDKAPGSAKGKKAALKLSAEKRANNRSEELRQILEGLLLSEEAVRSDLEAFASQVNDLNARLGAAEALAESERNQRVMSESITAAAEKRIQELEEVLVDVETNFSNTLKQKRKIVQLQGRIKGLEEGLKSSEADVEKERGKHEQFISDVNAAHEQVSSLEKELNEAETSLVNIQVLLANEQVEKDNLKESLKEAELRIEALDSSLKNVEKKLVQQDDSAKVCESVEAQLLAAQQALQVSLDSSGALEDQLVMANDQNEDLKKSLQTSESRIQELVAALENAEEKITLHDELKKTFEEVAEQRVEGQQALQIALEQSLSLEDELATTNDQNEDLKKSLQTSESRIKDLVAELENAEKKATLHDEAIKAIEDIDAQREEVQQALKDSLALNRALEEKLATAHEQSDSLKKSLNEVEEVARIKVVGEAQATSLEEQNKQLLGDINALRNEYDQESSIRKRLEKGAFEEDKRIQELEDALAKASLNASVVSVDEKISEVSAGELASLRAEVLSLTQRLNVEQLSRAELESEVDETQKLIDSLEKMIRETEGAATEQRSDKMIKESESQKVLALVEKLNTVEAQLEQELIEQKKLSKAVFAAEKKISEQEEELAKGRVEKVKRDVHKASLAEAVSQNQAKPAKLLPHELRPAPKKGAFFRPDWDLEGLPCQSSESVSKVWESVFNVQMSLEGYPSQYCMAFLVELCQEKRKTIYILYRLKLSKHTLVCVPAKTPKDEPSLKKAIKEGLNFLKMSGFDMEEMSRDHIDVELATYFSET